MKLPIIIAAALVLTACGSDPGSERTRGLATITGGPAMRYNAGGGVMEMSEADRYNYMCKDSPRGSQKVSFDGNGTPTCIDGVYRYSELCKDSYKGSHAQTWVIAGQYGCYDGVPVTPDGRGVRMLP